MYVDRRVPNDSDLATALLHSMSSLSETQGVLHVIHVDVRRDTEYILELLEHAPQLYAYVNTVRWDCQIGSNGWDSRAARSLALKLDRTRTLTLEQSFHTPLVSIIPTDDLTSIFPAALITKLYLGDIIFRSSLHYLRFLHAFSALEELTCRYSSWEARDATNNNECRVLSAPPLRRICIGHNSEVVDVTAKWLLAQNNPLHLEFISFHHMMLEPKNDLLRQCALTIRGLEIPGESTNVRQEVMYLLQSRRKEAAGKNSADLSSCTQLSYLKL
jgi:hypothetical protein